MNSSNGLQWFVCRKYSQRAFTNHAEIFQYETLCIGIIDRQFHGYNMCVESLSDHHQAHESLYPVINIYTTLQNSSSQHNLTGPIKKGGENNTKKPCVKYTNEESFIALFRFFPLYMGIIVFRRER